MIWVRFTMQWTPTQIAWSQCRLYDIKSNLMMFPMHLNVFCVAVPLVTSDPCDMDISLWYVRVWTHTYASIQIKLFTKSEYWYLHHVNMQINRFGGVLSLFTILTVYLHSAHVHLCISPARISIQTNIMLIKFIHSVIGSRIHWHATGSNQISESKCKYRFLVYHLWIWISVQIIHSIQLKIGDYCVLLFAFAPAHFNSGIG